MRCKVVWSQLIADRDSARVPINKAGRPNIRFERFERSRMMANQHESDDGVIEGDSRRKAKNKNRQSKGQTSSRKEKKEARTMVNFLVTRQREAFQEDP